MSSLLRKLQKRNEFNLTEQNSLSMRIGDLVPVYIHHLLPGDTFNIDTYLACRFAPMQAPMMSNVSIKTWTFAVPYRILWDDYEQFFTGKNKRGDEVEPTFPRVDYSNVSDNSYNYHADRSSQMNNSQILYDKVKKLLQLNTLADYLDYPVQDIPEIYVNPMRDDNTQVFNYNIANYPEHSILEARCYQMIYNECFRDQNVDEPVEFGTDSYIYDFRSERAVEEWVNLLTIRRKRWNKDYFTSALPTPSLAPDVALPVDSDVNFVGGSQGGLVNTADGQNFLSSGNTLYTTSSETEMSPTRQVLKAGTGSSGVNVSYNPNGTLRANDNDTTIRDLTYSRMVYQYLLDIARGGSVRYKDFVKTLFNVNLPDYRAEIPEYIGGGIQPVIVSEVLQTSETQDTPQGNMSGRATSIGGSHHSRYTAKEHTIIMTIACAVPNLSYAGGLPKRHFKFDRFDYYLPQFDHVGDQEIKRKELMCTGFNSQKRYQEETFGYAPRFSEYKSAVSRVHGSLRYSLAYWTMARIYNGLSSRDDSSVGEVTTPVLGPSFLEIDGTSVNRPFYVDSRVNGDEHLYLEVSNNVTGWRPMSKKSIPVV